jgi:hypothetical protein
MTNDFFIRRATIKDAKAIHMVLLAAFEEFRYYYSPEAFKDAVMSEERAKDRIREMNIYVAINKKCKIVGTIGW